MCYCSEDAPRTGERNVNFNKTTSENAVLNKMCKPDERAPSFIFKHKKKRYLRQNTLLRQKNANCSTFVYSGTYNSQHKVN